MPKLSLLVGPPGSGKSTVAIECYESYTYINQDKQGKEHISLFNTAVLAGENVVVDRMNFSRDQRKRYLDLAKQHGYDTEISVLHQPYQLCFERVMKRLGHETIKDERSAMSALNTFFTKYERVGDDEADFVNRVYPQLDMVKPLAIICDLDGTLCNVDHRLHFVRGINGEKKDWKSFFLNLKDDKVNEWCADILKQMTEKVKIVYCSGRPDDHFSTTRDWLKSKDLWDLCEGNLFMRPRGDHRQDDIAKEIILDFEILTRFTPYFFIDDRKQVVDLWRSRGFTCLACAKGDF